MPAPATDETARGLPASRAAGLLLGPLLLLLSMLTAIWFWLTRGDFGLGNGAGLNADGLRAQLDALGPMGLIFGAR